MTKADHDMSASNHCELKAQTLSLSEKNLNKTQGPHIFFFTLLFMLGNYESPCIVIIEMVTM